MTLFAPDLLRSFALGFGVGALILGVASMGEAPSSLQPQSHAARIGQSSPENTRTNAPIVALPGALDPGSDAMLAPLEIKR